MAKKNSVLLAALGVSTAVAAGALWWILVATGQGQAPQLGAQAPDDLARIQPATAPVETLSAPRSSSGAADSSAAGAVESSVAWPVKIELEMLRGAHVPVAKDVAAMGTGADATLRGRLMRGEQGLPGKLSFTGGANAGRELASNERGEFGALDLYPGLAEVHVEGPGIEAMREVRLRRGQTEELNISFDLPGTFTGQVFDRESKGLEGVDVELDGRHAQTDVDGTFTFGSATSGDAVQLVLKKPGFASVCSRVAVAAGRATEKGRYTFTMFPAATLELAFGPRVGGPSDAIVILLPEVTNTVRNYPWHRISPLKVRPGTTVKIDDLPAMRISVRVYHDGAVAEPESATAFLQAGHVEHHPVRFVSAPSLRGIVQDKQGLRLEGARVVGEAPDRMGATLLHLAAMPRLLEEEIIPTFPVAASETRTKFGGEFELSLWPKLGGTRYLWAQSADGKLWGGRAVATTDTQVTLTLEPVESGRASLSIDFPGRHQGLPVVVTIGGRPREEVMVPAGEPLVVGGIAAGTWRLKSGWNGQTLVGTKQGVELEIVKDTSFIVPLPEGAIRGQDADTLLRAGRSLPSFLVPISEQR